MSITISDIAKHVGVTKATVSKVLNKSSSSYTISEKTKQKIYTVVKELNYRPNHLSRALAGGKSMTIGLLINPIMLATPIQVQRIPAIEEAAKKSGYLIYIVANTGQETESIRSLLDRRVDGIIVYFATQPSAEVQEFLSKQSIPIVYVDWAPPGCSQWVKINREAGVRQIAEHLVGLGHRHIRYISRAHDLDHPERKLNFYRYAFEKLGVHLQVDEEFCISSQDRFEESAEIVKRLISLNRLPTALIMLNDYTAQIAISTIQDAGIKVPDQISVVGFDNLDFASMVRPTLTTVRQPIEGAAKAFDLLETLIMDSTEQVEMVDLSCELVIRQSTGPAAPMKI